MYVKDMIVKEKNEAVEWFLLEWCESRLDSDVLTEAVEIYLNKGIAPAREFLSNVVIENRWNIGGGFDTSDLKEGSCGHEKCNCRGESYKSPILGKAPFGNGLHSRDLVQPICEHKKCICEDVDYERLITKRANELILDGTLFATKDELHPIHEDEKVVLARRPLWTTDDANLVKFTRRDGEVVAVSRFNGSKWDPSISVLVGEGKKLKTMVESQTPDERRVTKAWAKFAGQSLGHCVMCGRELRDPTSIALGYGPECVNKLAD